MSKQVFLITLCAFTSTVFSQNEIGAVFYDYPILHPKSFQTSAIAINETATFNLETGEVPSAYGIIEDLDEDKMILITDDSNRFEQTIEALDEALMEIYEDLQRQGAHGNENVDFQIIIMPKPGPVFVEKEPDSYIN